MFTFFPKDGVFEPAKCFESSEWITYLCGQFEKCPKTQRRHFQGYVHGRSALGLLSVKKELGLPDCHLEVRRGTHEEARDYCLKEETRCDGEDSVELGDPPRQGTRTDLDHIRKVLDEGGLTSAFEEDFSSCVRYYRGFEKYLSLPGDPRDPSQDPECYYFYGPPGSGKTRAAYELAASKGYGFGQCYSCPLQGRTVWFDGFRPRHHRMILLDDYYRQWDPTYFLRFLDRYPLQVPVKGGFVSLPNVIIVVTSNYALEDQYPEYVDQQAFRRRFTKITKFGNPVHNPNKKQKTS